MKGDLVKKIDEAINTEEFVVPIYSNHLQSAVFWSGFDKKKQKIIIGYLKTLTDDSEIHAKTLKMIKKIICSEKTIT